MAEYSTKTYVVQRVLSAHVDNSEKLQWHNLFQIVFVVKDCRIHTIIDGGSFNNLVNADFVIKIGLMPRAHAHPYYIQWLNNSGKTKVTHTIRVHFSIRTYHGYVDCDVVSMQACSFLLVRPWVFDNNVVHHDRSNKYTLVHNGKKITLLPLTSNEIMQCNREIAETAEREYEIQHNQPTPPSSSHAIKLKNHALLATKSDFFICATVMHTFSCFSV
jgi:hypothetical protein